VPERIEFDLAEVSALIVYACVSAKAVVRSRNHAEARSSPTEGTLREAPEIRPLGHLSANLSASGKKPTPGMDFGPGSRRSQSACSESCLPNARTELNLGCWFDWCRAKDVPAPRAITRAV